MKRIISLTLLLLLLLTGCSSGENGGISFYYCRDPEQYQYFSQDGVIRAESRDLMAHRHDLQYMIGLYLAGPMEEGLVSPFTRSTRLLSAKKDGGTILIELSDHSSTMSDSEFTLACACLTLTCMEFTPCEEVTVVSGSRSITMDADNLLLYDTLPQQETAGG